MARPKHWLHDREHFYKYTDKKTALAILHSGKLRWSSPKRFNDPFDVQFDLHLDFDVEHLKRKCLDEHWRVLHAPEYKPVGILGGLIELFRQNLHEMPERSREQFDLEEGPAVEEGIQNALKYLPQLQAHVRQVLSDVKVLCLSEVPDNILMWSHYSELHRGVVFELRCVPELDSGWGAAESVKYASQMPRLFDEDFGAKMMSGQIELDTRETTNKVLFTKALDWSYEKEWRIIGGRHPELEVEDISFDPKELSAIYLGCKMRDEDQAELLALASSRYPETKLFRAKKDEMEFKLKFSEIPVL